MNSDYARILMVCCTCAAIACGCGGDDDGGASTAGSGGTVGQDAAFGGTGGSGGQDASQSGGAAGAGASSADGGAIDGSSGSDGAVSEAGSDADTDVATDADPGDGGDGGVSDAGQDVMAEAGVDAGGQDASEGGGPDAGPAPLAACDAVVEVAGPIGCAADLNAYGSYDPGPLMLKEERAFVFLAGSDMWMTAAHGSATTGAVPSEIEGASRLAAWRTMTGLHGVSYEKAGKIYATAFDGAQFSAPVETPCTSGGYACEARPAGDGHLWVRTGGNFFEQTAGGFENRGGGPTTPSQWDVDAQGTLIVLGPGTSGEVLAVWKLYEGAGGWTKAGALTDADVAAVDAVIEGGFQFGSDGLGAFAPDGSIHLFSDARCVGTGDHNKVQAYVRSVDGADWDVETLPSADDLTGGLVTWKNVAFWAGDFDNVRYVAMASPQPTFDGYTWHYPNRRYDVVARCEDGQGQATFVRVASAEHPQWTQRGYAGFSDWGAATTLTLSGLTQVY